MSLRTKHFIANFFKYLVLIVVGFFMIYPLLWMISATFKFNNEIFANIGLIPQKVTTEAYGKVFANISGVTLIKSMINTYSFVIPKVVFMLISATLTAYGFTRFEFMGRKFMYSLMIGTLFLPQVVLNIPQFLMFNKLGWVDSGLYLPLIVPTMFAVDTYFVFMLCQFMRGVPKELEEAAHIDGCNCVQTLWKVIVPMLKPSLVSCGLFQFMWSSNDYMGPLLYINSPKNYAATQFVKMAMDADKGFEWNRVLAISLVSIIPSLVVFFLAQDTFVDGIAAGGVKG